jgi:pseudouridine synthase
VGRLDKDSRGLIVLTNDGNFAFELTHAKFECEKEYSVRLDKDLSSKDIKILERGMIIDGIKLQPAKITYNKNREAKLIIKEGVNRQIRKMLGHLDYRVSDLQRIRIGKLKLNDLKLKEGGWKYIKPNEVI